LIVGLLLWPLISKRILLTITIFEFQRGLLYKYGKFLRQLEPGKYTLWAPWNSVRVVDTRLTFVTLTGQEVLSADNISLRLSLTASYKITDAYQAINHAASYTEALYLLLQLNLRDSIGAADIDTLLERRAEIGKQVLEATRPQAAELGLELQMVSIKDISFPGELRNTFAQVVNARKEGLAALERARGESAALRNLANAAHLLDEHPNLHTSLQP
jgi:regulator of protease activity HflC (stomatin/prohibitin superfamily)